MTVSTGATLAHSTSRRVLASGSGWAPPWSRPDVHFRPPLAAADRIACEDSGGGEDLGASRRRGRGGSRASGAWEPRDRTPRARAPPRSLARSLATGGTTRRGSARGGAGSRGAVTWPAARLAAAAEGGGVSAETRGGGGGGGAEGLPEAEAERHRAAATAAREIGESKTFKQ